MPRRLTNLLLLGMVLGLVGTGLLGWIFPLAFATPLYDLHRALGVTLVATLVWKQTIARSSLARRLRRRRPDGSLLLGLAAAMALALTVGIGMAWTLGLVSFDALWGYSPLNVHVFAGLALVPLVLWHLLRRWERKPAVGALLTRRSALHLLGLSAVTLALWPALERLADATVGAGVRRLTGSKHAGSFSGNAFPVTTWLFDAVPALDAASWRLELAGNLARPRSYSYAELEALPPAELTAVLDCTGGWWSEQRWRGVRVGDVLDASGVSAAAREATVVSVTGHAWTFPIDELRDALLATRVGDELLSPAHGYPVRLVAPGRRGFQWVKWVGRIEVA